MWKFFTDLKNSYFEQYLELIKSTVEEDTKKLDRKMEEMKKADIKRIFYPDSGYFDPYDDLADTAFQIGEMEQLMYRTHIIGVFIFMEAQITQICEGIYRKDKLLFSYKDLSGTGVGRSIKYLKKTLNKDFPSDQLTREDFEIAKTIRNALVHREGKIEKQDISKIKIYISKHADMISLKEITNEIEVTYNYARSMIELSKKICAELEKYNRDVW